MTAPLPATLLAAAALLAFGCARNGRTAAAPPEAAAFDSLRLSQGACFGTCPVYTLTVYPDGRAVYAGKQYTLHRGAHLGRVGGDTLAAVRALAGEVLAQADTLPREIESGATDISQRTVRLYADGAETTFVGDLAFAPPVQALLRELEKIAASESWERAPGTPPPPPNALVVTLAPDGDLDELRGEFFRQMFRPTDTLSTDPPTYRVTFDPYTMTAAEMIRDLESRADVVEAREED